jgi:3-hydroxyacyl-[acyl-carrier-protein] dehydratase
MPGVLQIEAMAQAAGLLLASMKQYKPESNLAFLASVDAAKFKGLVTPGDQLKIQVELRAARAGIYKFDAKAYVDSQLVSLATVVLAVRAR